MKKIILTGMMGSGKSAVSRVLSELSGIKCFETDEIFEQKFNMKIKDFFKQFNEEKFRLEETIILKEILKNTDFIISCGGGIILKEENRNLIFNSINSTFYLKTSPETVFNRIKDDTSRPLLQVKNPKQEIKNIISLREKYYTQAKYIVETDSKTPEEIAKEILKRL